MPARTLILMPLGAAGAALAQPSASPPLLPKAEGEAIAAEVSGAQALRTVRILSNNHRMPGSGGVCGPPGAGRAQALRTVRILSNNHRMRVSEGFRAAAEAIRDRLRDYGLDEVEIISLPADGRIFYGTQRSRPGWNARSAELWEGQQRIASSAEQPLVLAQRSGERRGG